MSSSVISAEVALALNRRVRESIDSRLFLFCNYEPTYVKAIHSDGKYLVWIQDLYKFAIDSGCVVKQYESFLRNKDDKDKFSGLNKILEQIQALRGYLDHNTSPLNGRIEKDEIEYCQNWISATISKPEPETDKDFELLNGELEKLAKSLVMHLDSFVDCIAQYPNRGKLVKDWIDKTLYWYCNNTKREIYMGQLIDVYIANARAKGRVCAEESSMRDMRRLAIRWIKAAMYYHIDSEIQECSMQVKQIEDMLDGRNEEFKELSSSLDEDKVESIKHDLQEQLAKNRLRITDQMKKREELDKKNNNRKFTNFFFKELEHYQLKQTMGILDEKGVEYTLLPQDLLQEDIDIFFKGVPSPDGYF